MAESLILSNPQLEGATGCTADGEQLADKAGKPEKDLERRVPWAEDQMELKERVSQSRDHAERLEDSWEAGSETSAVSFAEPEESEAGQKGLESAEEIVDISPAGSELSALFYEPGAEKDDVLHSQAKEMYLYDNSLSVIPGEIGKFVNLRVLKLFSNEVTLLPKEVANLKKLEQLYLKTDAVNLAKLPPLQELTSLRSLELHQVPARASGTILPADLGQFKLLKKLTVCHFSVTSIPAEVGSLTALEELDFSFNNISSLPAELASLSALTSLNVSSNQLTSLPAELGKLSKLTYLDVANNKLTSFESLTLSAMPSLKTLNAQFNKLQDTGDLPDWMDCNFEGNDLLQLGTTNNDTSENEEGGVLSGQQSLPSCKKGLGPTGTPSKKGTSPVKGQAESPPKPSKLSADDLQRKARQERLKLSRVTGARRLLSVVDSPAESQPVAAVPSKQEGEGAPKAESEESGCEVQGLAFADEAENGGPAEGNLYEEVQIETPAESQALQQAGGGEDGGEREGGSPLEGGLPEGTSRTAQHRRDKCTCKDQPRGCTCSQEGEEEQRASSSRADRQAIGGREISDASSLESALENEETSCSECEDEGGEISGGGSSSRKLGRRPGRGSDRNPKPCKRRRWSVTHSDVSYKYHRESFCGFEDRLHDGFYDAGRHRPFLPLEELKKEEMMLQAREVIVVDRARDEELDVITATAQQLLAESSPGAPLQRVALLALFVSDCFGGSDKSQSTASARLAALGRSPAKGGAEDGSPAPASGPGPAPAPAGTLVGCTCQVDRPGGGTRGAGMGTRVAGLLPGVQAMCEQSVRLLKVQLGSNVVPIGALPYGVCRHRAILFKYLCDRAEPVIPCELVRGFMDSTPHAWNVVQSETPGGTGGVRVLVDACRPLDIRPENDQDLRVRYLPLRRLRLPRPPGLSLAANELPAAAMHEEIGRGASGALVRRCSLGSLAVAAKIVRSTAVLGTLGSLGTGTGAVGPSPPPPLHELRLLSSLPPHPCVVAFYGHQVLAVPAASPLGEGRAELGKGQPLAQELVLFMEYMPGGSLEDLLLREKDKGCTSLPLPLAVHIAAEVARGLAFLHSQGIIHRDIKSSNVLVACEDATWHPDSPGTAVKLCDFSSAVSVLSSSKHTCQVALTGAPPADVCVGTPRWMAPEVLRAMYGRHPYGTEADLWSFGCLLLELLTMAVPFAGLSEPELHACIQMGQRPRLPAPLKELISASPSATADTPATSIAEIEALKTLVKLFLLCTEASPCKRPTAASVAAQLAACTESMQDASKQAAEANKDNEAPVVSCEERDEIDETKDPGSQSPPLPSSPRAAGSPCRFQEPSSPKASSQATPSPSKRLTRDNSADNKAVLTLATQAEETNSTPTQE